MQQKPTRTNIRIRSTRDAHKIFFAVQHRMLPMITRRLDADERLALCSGCVYAWEERGPHTEITGLGIERFTEGRRWSPSRVRDEFLFYYEKYTPPADAGHSGSSDKQPPRDWDPLVKQTYSVWVDTEKGRRKWHLTAYFTQATVDQLGTIDDIPGVAELVVPEGTFQSTRVNKNRKGDDKGARSDVLKAPTSSVTRTYAPFPAAYPAQPSPYSGPSASALAQEPYRLPLHSSPTQHSSEDPAYSVPAPLPPLGALNLPLLRWEGEDIEYKFRRPSLPGIPDYQPSAFDRRASMDYSSSPLDPSDTSNGDRRSTLGRHSPVEQYSSISTPSPITRHDVGLPPSGSSTPSDQGSESSARNTLPCTYANSSREPSGSQSTFGRPSSAIGTFQPIPKSSDREANSYTYSPHTASTLYPSPHDVSQFSLPPPTQLYRSELPSQLYEVISPEHSITGVGSSRLAPLHSLQRKQPYHRDPIDDKALRLLGPRSG
ncbi:Gti1/Pac2 family-domain-containing protein [Melanogaster broomeanus]|nr:Gti1/Pac2 family-domain-containing protein [Melanogaster broomeanus]